MYSGYGGSPSRSASTMSLSVRPTRRVLSRSITRSQSFAGVNSYDKHYRSLSVFSTPAATRKTPSRGSRMFTLSTKSPPPKVPQPERLDEVYEALKRGLQSYLQVHQMELDSLNRQMKESKRNSRLGFLYELDKQVKVIERFMRRLEFHLSKIDELYEAYCMQRRLRDGANKMVKAYTASPGSREARESLSEANKGFKEYTENMCMLESELENQLGEFHVKMKGLAGFARLCAGDQYEIFMKYGRQRWKLRGRIEINGKQVWDSEEMVFLPLITEFLSIKVTELKSLANHVVVGNVSCETKDLFAALPQTVAVDINDLGTIKLSLEVTWNPFDKDDQASTASTVNKAPTVNKRFSTYNQSPPDTPSLREQAFYSTPRSLPPKQRWSLLDVFRDTLAEKLSQSCSCGDVSSASIGSSQSHSNNMLRRQDEMENGTAWSNSSESSDDSSSPQLSLGLRHAHKNLVQPEVQAAAPSIEISFTPRESATSTPTRLANQKEEDEEEPEKSQVTTITVTADAAGKPEMPNGHARFSRSLSHISESSVDAALMERPVSECFEPTEVPSASATDMVMDMPVRAELCMVIPEPQVSRSSICSVSSSEIAPHSTEETCVSATESEEPTAPSRASSASCTHSEEDSVCISPKSEANSQQNDAGPSRTEDLIQAQDSKPLTQTHIDSTQVEKPENKAAAQEMVSGLEEALSAVVSSLDDYRGQFPELQVLEQELKLLEEALTGRSRSRSSSVSLTVETALGSFDFLNTSDLEDDEEEEEDGEKRSVTDSGTGAVEECVADDEGCQDRCWDTPSGPLSTGCQALDRTLLVHLHNCSSQLLRLGTFGPLRCGEMYALDRLLREARVLELIRRVAKDTVGTAGQPDEVIPQLEQCQGAVLLWRQCTDGCSVFSTSTETFLQTLNNTYASRLPERGSGYTDTVFLRLVERILEKRLPRRGGGAAKESLTIFQFWSYLEAEGVSELDTHITELAEEVWLVQSLQSGEQDVLLKALKRPPECSLKREGLRAVSLLLRDPRGKVCSSASSLLRSLAEQPRHRERALVSCLELLEDESVETRVCGCKALALLKAKESIEQLVYLCRTDKEDVRDAAKQALLVLGEEGKMAHRHVESAQDGVPRLFAPGSMASTAF
ncbi:rho family-interacting cell polarization regulator 1 isoform X1 [Astyanax mexicanus]|uniref:Rho family-interacting cell polarization regulator 1 isoform X1 n=1 Tax=Astyanax mexicanus TaxID=7994 RepID=A0A8T2LV87_ASTMX|nr:rho family-interacting cell polarization regulator 1 isoform X1 [Astyanax mexicanus]